MIAAKSTACSRFDSNFENVAASFSRFSRRGMLNKPVRPRFGPMAAVKRRASDASGGAMATPATLPVAVVACHPERHRGKVQRTLRRRGMVCERMHTQGNHNDMLCCLCLLVGQVSTEDADIFDTLYQPNSLTQNAKAHWGPATRLISNAAYGCGAELRAIPTCPNIAVSRRA